MFYTGIMLVFVFTGTVCIPLNHLCTDNGGGHLKVPAVAHWKQAKKHNFDNSSVREVNINTTSTNAAMGSDTSTEVDSGMTYDSSNSCGSGGRRWTVRGENASSVSWRCLSPKKKEDSKEEEKNRDVPDSCRHRCYRLSMTDIATPRKSIV